MPEDPKRPADADDDDDESADAETEPLPPVKPKAEASKKAAVADDDEDEDDDEEEDDDDEPPPPPKKESKPSSSAAKKRPAPPPRFQLPPEKTIGAPSRQTLVMLGVMAAATLAMWGSAKFACNAHPAQTRKPREVTTAELSRDPKDSALEMQQRWNAYDFTGALELAKGSMALELEKAQADCEKDKPSCDAKRKEVGQKTLATAVLLDRGPASAKVRVSSRGGALGEQSIVYQVEQEGPMWKVSGRTTADAPRPTPTPSAVPPTVTTPPAASEAPKPKPKIVLPKPVPKPPVAPAPTPAAP